MPEILIVDDEERMRRLLAIMLERRGFKVDQAGDGGFGPGEQGGIELSREILPGDQAHPVSEQDVCTKMSMEVGKPSEIVRQFGHE